LPIGGSLKRVPRFSQALHPLLKRPQFERLQAIFHVFIAPDSQLQV
jgi:hypothetical protein